MQTGWSSERVPLHASGNRRQLSGGGLFPYNNGRALPSKWEDAERWIFSPVSGDGLPHRRPKAKSGPLGPPGVAYYSLYSPTAPVVEGRNFTVGSPFSAGVFGADGLGGPANCHGVGFPVRTDPCMARSDLSTTCTEDKVDCVEDAATDISRVVSRRDMATQMSPASSNHSSPSKREVQSFQSPRSEVRDVQVDETVTVTRWSRKHRGSNNHSKGSEIVDWRKKVVGCRSSAWEVSETSTNFSKSEREEAKISAWENLQNAKAEAAIRKLEMKLEKKRSSSMKRIMKKLRSAQKRGQGMRSSVVGGNEDCESEKKSGSCQMGVLSGCFTCPAF
ncbi:hypothetical protein LINPERPRIM_LOCUS32856 [Linum perenne]